MATGLLEEGEKAEVGIGWLAGSDLKETLESGRGVDGREGKGLVLGDPIEETKARLAVADAADDLDEMTRSEWGGREERTQLFVVPSITIFSLFVVVVGVCFGLEKVDDSTRICYRR